MEVNRHRIEYLDITKGILIFLVVLGHLMPEEEILHIWIYSFHIPAFFIIDGFLLNYRQFENKEFKTIVLSGIKYLIIPYVIYCIPLLVARWAASEFDLDNLYFQIIDMASMCGIGAMWFLPCLFFARLLFYGVKYITRKFDLKRFTILISILCIFISSLIHYQTSIGLVALRSFVAVGFILIGDCTFSKVQEIQKSSKLMMLCIFIVIFFIITGCNIAALNVLQFGNIVWYIMNAILGSLVIISISIYLSRKLLGVWISYLGSNSLFIMGTHQLVMLVFSIPIVKNYLTNVLLAFSIVSIECIVIKILRGMKGKVKVA